MKLVPLSDRVVLKQCEAEETTKSGIILTSSAQEKPQEAEVIQEDNTDSDAVKMESTVVLHDVEFDEDIEYVIVGSSEADSLNNKISNESPLGAAMLGKKVGDIVKVEAPIGVVEYKIVSVKND